MEAHAETWLPKSMTSIDVSETFCKVNSNRPIMTCRTSATVLNDIRMAEKQENMNSVRERELRSKMSDYKKK